jgi:hypothetical protein
MLRGLVGLGLVLGATATRAAAPRIIENESFSFPIPAGYHDVTSDARLKDFSHKQVSVQADAATKGLLPLITVFLTPVWGGSLGDQKLCDVSATNMARDQNGKVRSATMVPGPRGTVCQIHLVSGEGVATLITELTSFTETWGMMCQHADGDQQAEKVCRATLAGFKFKERGTPAKIELPHIGVPECDDYLTKMRTCIWSRLSKNHVTVAGFALKIDAASLKKTAATEEGRKTLPGVCAGMLAQARNAMAAANCAW